ncbi:hypothetical protein NQZ79_g7500 [Umbelopsis isabellina]|nr:hypothetical protein NQZ79_g7500 [Umbelopsis isabellina]
MPVSAGANQIQIESIEIEGSQPFTFIKGDPSTPVIEEPMTPVTATYDLEAATLTSKIKADSKLEREKLSSMQKMMVSFLQGALQDKREGNEERYNDLISQLTMKPHLPGAPSPSKLYLWIKLLSQIVTQLDRSCNSLVEAVLSVDWTIQESAFVDQYIGFIGNLVSAHTYYVRPVFQHLVQHLTFRHKLPEDAIVTRSMIYQRVHNALRYVLSLIPTSATKLLNILGETFPHKRFNVAEQATYVNNLLETIDYAPILRKQVLGLIIEKIILIDVEIQIELEDLEDEVEIDAFDLNFNADYEEEEDSDAESDDEDDGEDAVAQDSDSDDELDSDGETETRTAAHIKTLVKKLDAMLHLVFRYLKEFHSNPNTAPEERQQLFFFLLDLFDRTVLRTFKSRYTQFLIFYFCSLDTITYPDAFLGHLFNNTFETSKPTVTRIASAAYISSYVARAKYIGRTSLRSSIYILTSWCEQYIDANEVSVTGPDVNKHPVFYAVVQAIMYIFCFRWRELVDDGFDDILNDDTMEVEDPVRRMSGVDGDILTGGIGGSFGAQVAGQKWCLGLQAVQRIVTSNLNPLKVCAPAVVRQFSKVAHQSNFLYVYPILERNKGIFYSTNDSSAHVRIESFFPFDPYQLKSSKHFVDSIYREWIADDDDEEDSDDEDDDDEDDEDVSAGMMAMSISPSPNQRMIGSLLAQRH